MTCIHINARKSSVISNVDKVKRILRSSCLVEDWIGKGASVDEGLDLAISVADEAVKVRVT